MISLKSESISSVKKNFCFQFFFLNNIKEETGIIVLNITL